MNSLRINEVAQAAGNRETLRYYERRGLIESPDRSPGGHRLYDERAVQTLRIIKAGNRRTIGAPFISVFTGAACRRFALMGQSAVSYCARARTFI